MLRNLFARRVEEKRQMRYDLRPFLKTLLNSHVPASETAKKLRVISSAVAGPLGYEIGRGADYIDHNRKRPERILREFLQDRRVSKVSLASRDKGDLVRRLFRDLRQGDGDSPVPDAGSDKKLPLGARRKRPVSETHKEIERCLKEALDDFDPAIHEREEFEKKNEFNLSRLVLEIRGGRRITLLAVMFHGPYDVGNVKFGYLERKVGVLKLFREVFKNSEPSLRLVVIAPFKKNDPFRKVEKQAVLDFIEEEGRDASKVLILSLAPSEKKRNWDFSLIFPEEASLKDAARG